MQHYIDEFSVADIRYTLSEAWRILSKRRWYFIFPCCAVTTIAAVCSLWVPRSFTSTTVIKREHDPVLASMMGRSWTEPYGEIGRRMASDLADQQMISNVIARLNLPEGAQLLDGGVLGPADAAARAELTRQVAQGISTASVEASPNRDIVAISLALPNPGIGTEILRAVRDEYVRHAEQRTVEVLRSVQQFFQSETERCRGELVALRRRLVEFETKYPGIDPEAADPSQSERAALLVERLEIERQREDLEDQVRRQNDYLAAARESSEPEAFTSSELEGEPNPRFVELKAEIERIYREIADNKMLRLMTDEHPVIRRLRSTLAVRQAELETTPATVFGGGGAVPAEGLMTAADKAERQIEGLKAKLLAVGARGAEVGRRLAELDRQRVLNSEHREEYLKMRQTADRVRGELDTWQANIGPIDHILAVEARDRGIHFATVQDVVTAQKPTSPKAWMTLLICLAIGACTGALAILLAELLDGSFRSIKHLRGSLGIPVIESVDEILTQPAKRQMIWRRLVLVPSAAAVLLAFMVAAGAMAYLSLEKPEGYQYLKTSPSRMFRYVFEGS